MDDVRIPVSKLNQLCWEVQQLKITSKWLYDNFNVDELMKLQQRFPLLFLGIKIGGDLEKSEKEAFFEVVNKQLGYYDPVEDKIEW